MRTKKVAIKKAKVTPAKKTKKVVATKKVVKAKAKPKAKKLKKYAVGGRKSSGCPDGYYMDSKGNCISDYDRNYPLMQDADREINYILNNQSKNWNNPKGASSVKWGTIVSGDDEDFGGSMNVYNRLPKYTGISQPFASSRSMKQYRDEIDAFYKANPNVKPYVGRLPIKKAGELPSTANKEIRMAKGGKKTSVKKYAKGGTKTSVKRVVRRAKKK